LKTVLASQGLRLEVCRLLSETPPAGPLAALF
jgi:hypothetical protein